MLKDLTADTTLMSIHYFSYCYYSLFLLSLPFNLQFNFVGRILGPRGMTTKQLEQETGCKIMVRGKGSMRDKKKVKKKKNKLGVLRSCCCIEKVQVGKRASSESSSSSSSSVYLCFQSKRLNKD